LQHRRACCNAPQHDVGRVPIGAAGLPPTLLPSAIRCQVRGRSLYGRYTPIGQGHGWHTPVAATPAACRSDGTSSTGLCSVRCGRRSGSTRRSSRS
jgi:hypothetical protein